MWPFLTEITYLNKVTISVAIKNIWASGPDLLVIIYKKRVLLYGQIIMSTFNRVNMID